MLTYDNDVRWKINGEPKHEGFLKNLQISYSVHKSPLEGIIKSILYHEMNLIKLTCSRITRIYISPQDGISIVGPVR